jgi:FAD/FMN-containing dehydrogenase
MRVCPTVGVGGHLSGDGFSTLMRRYDLTSDNILDALLLDVDGRLLNRSTMGMTSYGQDVNGDRSPFPNGEFPY